MPPNANQSASRREFMRATARYGWVVGLGAALGWLAMRDRPASSCSSLSPCVSCPAFDNCGLPPALHSRQTNGPGVKVQASPTAQP
jgi:hypothetical protein